MPWQLAVSRLNLMAYACGRSLSGDKNWRKLLAEVPGWTAESFEAWYHLWNMRDEDIAKLMDGVTKSGVLEAEAKPGQ